MRRTGYYLINSAFLIYGLIRLIGAVPGFAHIMNWWDNSIGSQIESKLDEAFPELSEKAIVVLSLEVYMGWSVLMGVVLTLGSALALFKIKIGYVLMAIYYILFGLMFINYWSIDTKIIHFIIGLSLFVLMIFLSKRRTA